MTGVAARMKLLLLRLGHKRMVIAGVILAVSTFLFVSRSGSFLEQASTAESRVALDSLEPRLKAFSLNKEQQRDLKKCLQDESSSGKCPSYFAWIHEDLAPWETTGITREHMEEAKRRGDFHIAIVDGKLYHQRFQECIQTRDEITLRGLLMLLEMFPGRIPDMEMVFVCNDFPGVPKGEYAEKQPPPVFSYCTGRRGDHYDILFPDWSFWGWPDVKIRPWTRERAEIFAGASSKDWFQRQPLAYWKGNVWVMTKVREDLLACNTSDTAYNVLVYYLDWAAEAQAGYKTSSLAQQCHTRYKVYAEGRGWSASLKYIVSCGSTVLHIEPDFWEFFARSWVPYVHYWPVSRDKLCPSIKYAVDWGNARSLEASEIGQCGKAFMEKHLTMDHVYSYMVHVMQAYAKLQKFKPVAPEGVQPLSLSQEYKQGLKAAKVCDMIPRDQASIAKIVAAQAAGYQLLPVL